MVENMAYAETIKSRIVEKYGSIALAEAKNDLSTNSLSNLFAGRKLNKPLKFLEEKFGVDPEKLMNSILETRALRLRRQK